MKTFLTSVKESSASGPSSRPRPDCLKPPNGRRVAHRGVRVDREVAGLDAARHPQRPADVAGPDRPGQAVLRVVGHPDRVGLVVERHHRHHRPEHLLAPDPVLGADAGARRSAGTSSRGPSGAAPRKATSTAVVDVRRRRVALLAGADQRAHLGVVETRGADLDPGDRGLEQLEEPVVDAALHEDPAARAAVLAGVVEDAVRRAWRRPSRRRRRRTRCWRSCRRARG